MATRYTIKAVEIITEDGRRWRYRDGVWAEWRASVPDRHPERQAQRAKTAVAREASNRRKGAMQQMRDEGKTLQQIGRKFGVTRQSVHWILSH